MTGSAKLSPPNRSVTPTLPMAMRDTALTVTELKLDAQVVQFAEFRDQCKSQVRRLRDELAAASYSNAVIEDATYAQCALLDEIALIKLTGNDHDAWAQDPLQVSEFQSHEAGNELIERIERCLADPNTPTILFGVFFETFNQGFKGKFTIAGEPAREHLSRALEARAARESNPSLDLVDLSEAQEDAQRRAEPRSTRLVWGALVAVATISIYCGLQLWTSAAIASLPA